MSPAGFKKYSLQDFLLITFISEKNESKMYKKDIVWYISYVYEYVEYSLNNR